MKLSTEGTPLEWKRFTLGSQTVNKQGHMTKLLCLVSSPSIEKKGGLPLGSKRALLHLPEASKSAIISCLILYTNDFHHCFTSLACTELSTVI